MKLYTPTEIARFVVAHDFGDATEREVIEALREWEKRTNSDGDSVGREALLE